MSKTEVQLAMDEQKAVIREAIKAKVIPSMEINAWKALTEKEAKKMIKDQNLIEATQQKLEEKALPKVVKDGNEPATKHQIQAIRVAVAKGEIDRLNPEEFKNLTKQKAFDIISDLHSKRPTELATSGQKERLYELINKGHLRPIKKEIWIELTKDEASEKINIGSYLEKEGKTYDGYDPSKAPAEKEKSNFYDPMTDSQKERLSALVSEGYLNKIDKARWSSLTIEDAGKLIYIGKQRESRGEKAPEPQAKQGMDR